MSALEKSSTPPPACLNYVGFKDCIRRSPVVYSDLINSETFSSVFVSV